MVNITVICRLIILATISLLGCRSNEVHFEVDLNTILATNNVTSVGHVFGLTAYGDGNAKNFATPAGVEYLKHWNVDFIGFANDLGAILPAGKNDVLSPAELKEWTYSAEARKQFEATATYSVLKSQGITKAGSQQLLFLRDSGCVPHCASVECYKNLTPKPLNGTDFEWWATLFTGFYRFCTEADPNATLLHIWNEPNTYFYHDHKNGTYFAEFYMAIAASIRKEFPNAIIGGPVLEDDPTGPTRPNSTYSTWEDYSKTLIDAAVPQGLLDYFDFHSYSITDSSRTFTQPLLGGVHTVDAYSYVRYGKHLTSAITESNIKIFNDTEAYIRSSHFNLRTFALILNTMALLKNPDKIKTRMIFDYKTPGKKCNCRFNGYPNSTSTVTPEMEAYYLLGKLRDGTRLFVDAPIVNVSPDCKCLPGQSIQYGNSSVLLEAAYSKGNLTIVIVNMCNCSLQMTARINGIDQSQVLSSWGAVLDVESLREVADVPQVPDLVMSLPPTSLVTLSYTLKTPYHLTTNTVSFVHYYPKASDEIMVSMPVDIGCNYHLPVLYDLNSSDHLNAKEALIRFGVLGPAENYTWNITTACQGPTTDINVSVYAPGAYAEVSLPCVPDVDHNGVTTVKFSVVDCGKTSYVSPTLRAYFEFSVLILRY